MLVTTDNLNKLRVGYSAAMKRGLAGAPKPLSPRVAMTVPSTTKEQRYGWLGKMPKVREWVGPRVVQNLTEADYSIKEKRFELTIGVDRDDIETDNLGQYSTLFEGMGEAAVLDPEQMIWDLLKAGFTTNCYDGQYFFDTDHPVLNEAGEVTSVAKAAEHAQGGSCCGGHGNGNGNGNGAAGLSHASHAKSSVEIESITAK